MAVRSKYGDKYKTQRRSSVNDVCVTHSVVSNSLQSHEFKLARLLCPWTSPGKNTVVGCHALLQGNLPDPEIEHRCPVLQVYSLPFELPKKPLNIKTEKIISKWQQSL